MKVFKSGPFKGVDVHDAFARAASTQEPVVVQVGPIAWPPGLAPTAVPLGNYAPGTKITGALQVKADVLIILYTEQETRALLEVFTGNNDWSSTRQKQWCGYAHNFAAFRSTISGISGDPALEEGIFGYLSAVQIGGKTVVLYKTELHPKANGDRLPFVPVLGQLISEAKPALVLSTGTAGSIGSALNCGDVVITNSARFHCQVQYPDDPEINTLSAQNTLLTNAFTPNSQYLDYAAATLTGLSLDGLGQCYDTLQKLAGYGFVKKNAQAPAIYVSGQNPVPGPQPTVIVSADFLTVDDSQNSEGLQALGSMNDTDDAFAFYAINQLAGSPPNWLSVRNVSDPQIVDQTFPHGTTAKEIQQKLENTAGAIYGIYQYCTTLNSAFACWGIVAGM